MCQNTKGDWLWTLQWDEAFIRQLFALGLFTLPSNARSPALPLINPEQR